MREIMLNIKADHNSFNSIFETQVVRERERGGEGGCAAGEREEQAVKLQCSVFDCDTPANNNIY